MKGILGRKVGMTQVFNEDGVVTPVTVVEAGPCVVLQKKEVATDGYEAFYSVLTKRKNIVQTSRNSVMRKKPASNPKNSSKRFAV